MKAIVIAALFLSACGASVPDAPKNDKLIAQEGESAGEGEGEGVVGEGEGEGEGTPTCTVIDGNLTVENGIELNQYRGCTILTGDLTISNTPVSNISALDSLVEVDGTISIQSTQLTSISFPNLVTIGGWIEIGSDHQLEEIDFPVLQAINGPLHPSVGGSLFVDNPRLPECQVTALMTRLGFVVGDFTENGNDTEGTCP